MPIGLAEGALRFRRPTHVVVRGTDPTSANLGGLAVASALDPEFSLLEVRSGQGTPSPGEIRWDEFVPVDRHMITFAPAADAPPDPLDPRTAWPVVRADRPEEVISHLAEFLSAPEASEQALRRRFPIEAPMPILIANGWILAHRFPDEPSVTGHLMSVQKQFGVSVILATDETVRRDLVAFDVVFDVIVPPDSGGEMRLRCVRSSSGSDLRAGDEFPIGRVEEIGPGSEPGSDGPGAPAGAEATATDLEGARKEPAQSSNA
jgi:hypothetical protein